MNLLYRSSVKTRLSGLLAILALANIIVMIVVMAKLGGIEDRFTNFYQVGVTGEKLTLAISRDVNFVSRLTRSIMLGDNYDKNLKQLDETIAKIDQSFNDLKTAAQKLEASDARQKFESAISASQTDTKAFLEDGRQRMLALKDQERTPETLKAAWDEYHKAATPLANKARESFKVLSEFANTYMEDSFSNTNSSIEALHHFMPVSMIVAIVLTVVFSIAIIRSILTPLRQAIVVAEQVAGGDLSKPIDIPYQDETGQLLRALQTMKDNLVEIVRSISMASESIASSAGQFSQASQSVSQHSQEQSQATLDMAASMEEMTVSISQVTDSAGEAHSLSRSSEGLAGQGREVVQNAAEEIHKIAQSVADSAGFMAELNQRANEISGIVNVIKDIADQTNLLALNAAIEAARAGEQGRGFAVVADEVRQLAERTARSTQEISTMLSGVQSATSRVVGQMEESTGRVEKGAAMAREAGGSMQQIMVGASSVVSAISGITDALREQSSASNQISSSVETIAQMTERNNEEVQRITAAAAHLDGLAKDLDRSIHRFHLN